MVIEYRPVVETEIPETIDLFLASLADVYARTGIKSPLPPRSFIEMHYRHIYRTGIFYVAEINGRIGAIGHAVVRDQLWFLSGFWARPDLQGQRIGGPLLKLVRDEGARAGARTFFTWSSLDLAAMASYMKIGMLPGYQILTFAGTPRGISVERKGVEINPLILSTAASIDAEVRATRREVDHRFWLEEAGHQAMEVRREGHTIGYFYFNKGTIGPAAWTGAEQARALLDAACREAAQDSGQVRLMIPGVNHAAIRFALDSGLRLAAFTHLLTSATFGRMEQYLASGPSLF